MVDFSKYAERGGGVALAGDLFLGVVGVSAAALASPLLLLFSGGCAPNEGGEKDDRCTECHPYLKNGETRFISEEELQQYAYGVGGAHKLHYNPRVSNPLSCSVCHPTRKMDQGPHIDPKVWEGNKPENERDVILDGFDPVKISCMVSYCHGETEMFWDGGNTDIGLKGYCNYCHLSTEPKHDANDDVGCFKCHDDTMNEDGSFKGDNHMNFTVEVKDNTCSACHGEPPKTHPKIVKEYECSKCHDVPESPFRSSNNDPHRNGEVSFKANLCSSCHDDPDDMQSGAHYAHLHSEITAPISCQTCHQEIPVIEQLFEHFGWPIMFSGLAVSPFSDKKPSYNQVDKQCASTYCHGFKEGNVIKFISWFDTSGKAGECGACHGLPPTSPEGEPAVHDPSDPVFKSCTECHPALPTQHINGKVDLKP